MVGNREHRYIEMVFHLEIDKNKNKNPSALCELTVCSTRVFTTTYTRYYLIKFVVLVMKTKKKEKLKHKI